MPTLDIFNDDAFSVSSLTAAIAEQPYVPGRLGQLGLFGSKGINTTTVQIEKVGNLLILVPAGERGQPGTPNRRPKRNMIPFNTIHLPQTGAVMADEVQNVRAFGSETEIQAVQNVVNDELSTMRRNLDATIEFQRIGAVKGQIVDSDGSTVLVDLFTAFGISQTTVNMALGVATTKIRKKCMDILNKVEDALGAAMWTRVRAVCGRTFFQDFIDHDDVRAAYERYNQGEMLRNDPRGGFDFGGITWEQYRGKVGSTAFVPDAEAYIIVEGVPDLYITRFAPADYIETVNTMGLPYYAKQELMKMGKGIDLDAQSNPISLCTRPSVSIKLTES